MRRYRRTRNTPFPSKNEYRRSTLKKHPSFLAQHNRLLSVIGAAIVFLTFIVKDAKREELRDLIDAIAAAQAEYDLRKDSVGITDKLSSIYVKQVSDSARSDDRLEKNSRLSIRRLIVSEIEGDLDSTNIREPLHKSATIVILE